MAARQGAYLEDHDQAHHRVVEERTRADAVGEDEAALQLVDVGRRDGGARQAAEARVDAVDLPLPRDHGGDDPMGGVDRGPAPGIEFEARHVTGKDGAQLVQGQRSGAEDECGHGHP